MLGRRWVLTCALLALASSPAAVFGQQILARVNGAEPESPLTGAIVSLLGPQGTVLKSYLTNQGGSATFRDVTPGDYRLRAQMIGRATVETEMFQVEGDLTVRTIVLPIQPITLAGIDVQGGDICSRDQRSGASTFAVWDEARKALLAAQITQAEKLYRFDIARRGHSIERPTQQSVDTASHESTEPFWSLTPAEFERDGYVRYYNNLSYDLFGPSTDVVLSPGFERTHCFSLRRDGNHRGQIGLRFTLARDRDITDIEGTLWLDEASSELRSLDFKYRKMAFIAKQGDHGGDMEYQRLDNGSWIIRRWRLYSPLKEEAAEVIGIRAVP